MRLDALTYRYPGPDSFCLGPLDVEGPDDRPWLVLGASGSGKSTLLRLLGGSLRPTAGVVQGLVPRGYAAYLPQLPERALAGRNLAEDLCGDARPPCGRRSELRAVLKAVDLVGAGLSRPSRTLSAGERRRVAIALLLVAGHDHWALDEPDAALDAAGVDRVVALLRERRDAMRGGLWVATHRYEAFVPLRPWVLVLDRGRAIATGEIGEVLRKSEVARLVALPHRPAMRLWDALRERCGRGWGGLDEPAPGRSKLAQLHTQLSSEAGLS